MKKILIFPPGPFYKRDYERFGIKHLKENFSVKVLDFPAWLKPNHWKECSSKVYKCEEYTSIENKKDFLEFNTESEPVIVLDDLEINFKTNWIRKQFKKRKSLFVSLDFNLIPIDKKTFLSKLSNLLSEPIFFFHVIAKYFRKYFDFNKFYQPEVSIVGGLASLSSSKAKCKIYAHSMDYDIYLNLHKEPVNEDSYAVFLDEGMVDHPDLILLNLKKPMDEMRYYEILNKFFKKFEKETKLKVKFSAHPKTKTQNIKKYFKDFEFSIGNTPELVKNSSMVLLHSSTSISYAILFKKPVIFLTSDELEKSWIGNRIVNFSKILNANLINMNTSFNNKLNIKDLSNFDKLKYQAYKDQYLKFPNSPDVPLWEIFTENIKKIYNNKII